VRTRVHCIAPSPGRVTVARDAGVQGYASDALRLAAREDQRMGPESSAGSNETVLRDRACWPCPPDVVCSSLTVAAAPHLLAPSKSIYPVPYLQRALLPYGRTVACLHPLVCNAPPEVPVPQTWDEMAAYVIAGHDQELGNTQYRCRDLHDVQSFKCSGCQEGAWKEGFLCRKCVASASVLLPLAVALGVVLLGVFLWVRFPAEAGPAPFSAGDDGGATSAQSLHSVTLLFSFLQISDVIHLSDQINAARSGRGQTAAQSAMLDWSNVLAQFLAFTPSGAECLLGSAWNDTSSTVVVLMLPWLVVAAALVAYALRHRARLPWSAAALVYTLDLLYMPVTQRVVTWFNVDSSELPGTCFVLQLPSVQCDTPVYKGVLALAVITFVVFLLGLPALATWVLFLQPSTSWRAAFEFLQANLRPHWSLGLSSSALHFLKKFVFAGAVGSSKDVAQTLPLVLFTALLVSVCLQVSELERCAATPGSSSCARALRRSGTAHTSPSTRTALSFCPTPACCGPTRLHC
jgi:hypothetical protein